MTKPSRKHEMAGIRGLSIVSLGVLLLLSAADQIIPQPGPPIDIGRRLELFVDDYLLETLRGARLLLHHPVSRAIAIIFDKPWEGNTSAYVTVFVDKGLFRMYYRGSNYDDKTDSYSGQVVCYAESADGIVWKKPELGLFAHEGSKKTNIVWEGIGSHNFTPFKDANPDCPAEERYKALGSETEKLYVFKSPDGIHWSLLRPEPILTGSEFDSQNLAFWHPGWQKYLEFHRGWKNEVREIRHSTSSDFRNWTEPQWLDWGEASSEHLYTNGILPYFRAPHILVGFPMRFVPERKAGDHKFPGVSDGLFMSSRDGLRWKRWPEAFLRPGLQGERWINRNNMICWGLLPTKSDLPGAPEELSLYSSEGYYVKDCRMRRHTLRLDGFVSVNAGAVGGEMVTKPLVFDGQELVVNFSTSAVGSIRVEIQDERGRPIQGFALGEGPEIFGDSVEHVVRWREGSSLEKLAGRAVKLRFLLWDADLYSLRFR